MTTPTGPGQASSPGVRWLLVRSVPALAIGVLSAVLLWLLDEVAALGERLLWTSLPGAWGVDPGSPWWILGVLTATGFAVGLVLERVPGHGGPDSATVELVAPTLPLRALPGVAAVTVLGLAGGVSLGPESAIIGVNVGLAVWLAARAFPVIDPQMAVLLTVAGTGAAMFGTPVAAALILTGMLAAAPMRGALWDRLFLPLVAAGAGALTIELLHGESFVMDLPTYSDPDLGDLMTAGIVATVAAAIGVVGAFAFPRVHRLLHRVRRPVLLGTLGGVLLGLLGMLGGELSLFKGLAQTGEVIARREEITVGTLVVLVVVKLAALLVAASAGFRGGRVFPAVFIGATVGVLGNAVLPGLPAGLAVGAGVLGIVLAVGRDGWLALFLGVAVAGDVAVLPVLCFVVLPAWLVVTRAPEFLVHADPGSTGRRSPYGW